MKKAVRYTLWIGGSLLTLLLLAWVGIAVYVTANKTSLLKKANDAVSEKLRGQVHITGADISVFRHFPDISLHLAGVSVRDSLWEQHHRDLLNVTDIYVRVGFFSLFSGHPRVSRVYLQKGVFHLFTDSTGYSNNYLIRNIGGPKKEKPAGEEKSGNVPDISLSDMRFVLELLDRHKLFDLSIRRLDCGIQRDGRSLLADVNTDIHVNSFCFNTDKGSFIKDKNLSGRFPVRFNTASKIIQFNDITLRIDKQPYRFSGRFFPDVKPDPFFLSIQTTGAKYRDVTAFITPGIVEKLNQYDIDKPVDIDATLDAGAADDPEPQILVHLSASHVTLSTPIAQFNDCSFKGMFINEWVRGLKREDPNSGMRFVNFTANWENIPVRSDTIVITNLKLPLLKCNLRSDFNLSRLNDVTGSNTLRFAKGTCKFNISSYTGPLSKDDTTATSAQGTVDLDSATLSYLPFGFNLTNCQGHLRFANKDFFIDKIEAHAGSSSITVNGAVQNLLTLLAQSPEKLIMDLDISSPRLDIADLAAFAGNPADMKASSGSGKGGKGKNPPLSTLSARVDQFLRDGAVNVKLQAADIRYKKFTGAKARASITFKEHTIDITQMQLNQKSGSLTLKANMRRVGGKSGSPITLTTHLDQVDLPGIFAGFNNFGQKGMTDKNLRGTITADINLTGRLTDQAEIAPKSLHGLANFSIKNGQLVDFEPLMKIQDVVFKHRDLANIQFADLKTKMFIDSTTVRFDRMEIRSTAFTFFVAGLFDFKTGTDMSIQFPFSNFRKTEGGIPPKKGNDAKVGMSIWLRAKTGDDGKLNIRWDPFKKGLKKQQKAAEATEKSDN